MITLATLTIFALFLVFGLAVLGTSCATLIREGAGLLVEPSPSGAEHTLRAEGRPALRVLKHAEQKVAKQPAPRALIAA